MSNAASPPPQIDDEGAPPPQDVIPRPPSLHLRLCRDRRRLPASSDDWRVSEWHTGSLSLSLQADGRRVQVMGWGIAECATMMTTVAVCT